MYEMGVRSFTADESSGVGAEKQGTYAGLLAKVPAPSLSCLIGLFCLLAEGLCVFTKDVCCPASGVQKEFHEYRRQPKHATEQRDDQP